MLELCWVAAATAGVGLMSSASPNVTCVDGAKLQVGNMIGTDIADTKCASASACAAECCTHPMCTHFTFTTYQPAGPNRGTARCWLKRGAMELHPKRNCTSGVLAYRPTPAPPPPPPPPAPSTVWTPTLTYVSMIAFDPRACLRDPSAAVQDPKTKRWHFWVDHMNGTHEPGWHAFLHHYSAQEITGPWTSHGLALPHSTDPTAWDFAGTFSPSVIFSPEEELWWLFYSASGANQSKLSTCAQLVASASSPDGPWTRRGVAAAPTGSPANGWAGAWNTRRLDSGRALVVGGRKGYWTKGCSMQAVAQEGVYRPSSPSSWAPPYAEAPHTNPLFAAQPWCKNGYENCEFFKRPNSSELHVWCSWHAGPCGKPGLPPCLPPAPHFIIDLQSSPLGTNWSYSGALNPHNASDHASPAPGEPTPVYEDGLPGDGATVRYMIARMNTGKGTARGGQLGIGLYRLSWLPPMTPPAAATSSGVTLAAMKNDDASHMVHGAVPDLCHQPAIFHNYVGNGTGNASVDTASGCTTLHFQSTGGMAADFTVPSFAVKPLQYYQVSLELKTNNLLPTPLLPNCVEQQGAAFGAEPGSKKKLPSCEGAYLTGGPYVTYADSAGRSDGWFPAYGAHATPTADWKTVTLEFAPPTTAASVTLHFAFGAHEYAYHPDRAHGGMATGECWMRKLSVKELPGKQSGVLPVTFSVPASEVNLTVAARLAGNCLHNSQISGNFTVGSDYVISGNLSPDLAFGLLGTRRLAHSSYMRTWEATWLENRNLMGPDGRIGYFQRVMAHTLWPLGVDALFSFSGNVSYLEENLPFVDKALAYLATMSDPSDSLPCFPKSLMDLYPPGADWVDWQGSRAFGATTNFATWYVRALRRFAALHAEFASTFGNESKAAEYLVTANKVTVSVQTTLWIDTPDKATNWARDGAHFATNARHDDACGEKVLDDGLWVDDQLWAVVNGVATSA